jgi:predicted adenine nucleotide alpha hydrolase (AANH) superfamily ATPase
MIKEIRIRRSKQSTRSTMHNVWNTERKKEKKRHRESQTCKESRVIRNKYCMCKTRRRGRQVRKMRKQTKNFARRED